MAKAQTRYKCRSCGYISASYLGRCPNCGSWNQFEKEVQEVRKTSTKQTASRLMPTTGLHEPVTLEKVKAEKETRIPTKFSELNRVLGGGIVTGSLVLIGEESASQIKLRADRLGVGDSGMYLYPETNMSNIRDQISDLKPDFVVIDSIQTMNEPSLDSMVGSAAQVREVTSELMHIAKIDQITVFIIGHVTKEGAIAGPKILEHMVDTVLYFEGDEHHAYRILHSVKNRFGAANEIGMFEMENSGLKEVTNPSSIFLDERLPNSTGSCVVVSLEGTRPILAEVQALVAPTAFGYAKRTTSGIDYNKAALLLAVLEKRGNLMLQNQDAYLTTTGGIKLSEPAIDLAIVMAIGSSYKDMEIPSEDCFVGEVGLTGEVRRVNKIESRIAEAEKIGFKRIFIPKFNMKASFANRKIEVVPVSTVAQALKLVFG